MTDHEIVKQGEYDGFKYIIMLYTNPVDHHYAAYIENKNHIESDDPEADFPLHSAHGGVTYGDKNWIGWDYGHVGLTKEEDDRVRYPKNEKTVERIFNEDVIPTIQEYKDMFMKDTSKMDSAIKDSRNIKEILVVEAKDSKIKDMEYEIDRNGHNGENEKIYIFYNDHIIPFAVIVEQYNQYSSKEDKYEYEIHMSQEPIKYIEFLEGENLPFFTPYLNSKPLNEDEKDKLKSDLLNIIKESKTLKELYEKLEQVYENNKNNKQDRDELLKQQREEELINNKK